MSSAFYPLGMNSSSNHLPQGGYKTWKGTGIYENPTSITSKNIRPLTNKDYGNVFSTGHGLARPIKHYRKGTIPNTNFDDVDESIKYNLDRTVKSSCGASLGGGSGGRGMISQLNDTPGSTMIKDVNDNNTNECICNGNKNVSGWFPIDNLTEKPQHNVTNPVLCCNQQKKAKKRVLGANTNVSKNYYQTSHMYLYNRCQTFKQREFNYLNGPINNEVAVMLAENPNLAYRLLIHVKPGESLAIYNQYVAQCTPSVTIRQGLETNFIQMITSSLYSNSYVTLEEYNDILNNSTNIETFLNYVKNILDENVYDEIIYTFSRIIDDTWANYKGCSQVYYKPNNPQYAQQGAVSSSSRILKLTVDTITTNAHKNKNNLYKNKSSLDQTCDSQYVLNMLKRYRQLGIK